MQLVLTHELLLEAYRQGLFPMAYSAESPYVHWICPELRGQLSITELHIPKRLKKTTLHNIKQNVPYQIKINTAFEDVVRGCAEKQDRRPETWINAALIKAYNDLHQRGHAHSVECWIREEGQDVLAGGLYGVAIGGAFFGESMFSRRRDASKIALIHLVARLWRGGYTLLDTQFINNHLRQFGVYEIPHKDYMAKLKPALQNEADFLLPGHNEGTLVHDYLGWRDSQSSGGASG